MPYLGADCGFVGQSSTMADPYQDRQRTLNYYPERSADDKSKVAVALLGTPGLDRIINFARVGSDILLPYTGGVRGGWVLPGGERAIWVVGSAVITTQVTVPATQTSIAQFSVSYQGTIGTNSGPVSIRDNGNGGYAVIVDGSSSGYLFEIATNTFSTITDPAFYGADKVAFIDGWLIFNKPGTQIFYTTGPTPYTVTFPGAFFALKDSNSDNLITLMENNRELWLIGERASEVWYNAGGANFAFARIPGVSPQIGTSSVASIARVGTSLVWLASNEQGQNIVVMTEQYSTKRISTPAVEAQISQYTLVSDAEGFSYEEDGHLFYVLSFPTADKTWVYDATTGWWHERASFNSTTGAFHVWKGSCCVNYQNLRVVGDRNAQRGYQMSRQFYNEYDSPLVALRRAPHLWSRENRKRLFHASLQIEFAAGVGLQTGQGSNPQAMLRWSDDGGANFGTEHWTGIGRVGRTKNRALWRRLGHARDRVYEMRISDPVLRDVVGATLFAQGEVEG